MSPQKKATLVSTTAAVLLIFAKLSVGLLTGTVSVIASAMDSLVDSLVSFFNFFAITKAEKPSDDAYNYGRGKIEGIASVLQGGFILVSAAFIIKKAFDKAAALPGPAEQNLLWPMATMILSIAVTSALVVYLRRVGRQTGSLIIQGDTLHYQSDLLSNAGILLALLVIKLTGWHILDPIIAFAIAVYISYAALPLVRNGLHMLMDRALNDALVENIKQIASNHSDKITGAHEFKTRQSGDTNFVEFHLVFDEQIRLREAHRIGDEIEMRIRDLEKRRWVINIHLDPVDDSHRDQRLAKLEG